MRDNEVGDTNVRESRSFTATFTPTLRTALAVLRAALSRTAVSVRVHDPMIERTSETTFTVRSPRDDRE